MAYFVISSVYYASANNKQWKLCFAVVWPAVDHVNGISVLSGQISMKLAIYIHHVAEDFQHHRSKVIVMTGSVNLYLQKHTSSFV